MNPSVLKKSFQLQAKSTVLLQGHSVLFKLLAYTRILFKKWRHFKITAKSITKIINKMIQLIKHVIVFLTSFSIIVSAPLTLFVCCGVALFFELTSLSLV